jgi:2-polyprenyl-3-methyl-5-hydroxy-6-metoxy-1,4-benzoquinol methylase
MMPATDSVQRYWDKNASNFDALYESGTPLHRAFNAVFRKALFERIKLAADVIKQVEGATVLDVGCGSGRTTIPLARVPSTQVTGIDFAANMIELARKAAAEANVEDRCKFVVGDFTKDAAGGPFDYVTALGVLDYVDEPVPFVRRMLELSKRAIMFSVPKPSLVRANLRKLRYGRHGVNVHFHTAAEIRKIGEAAGAKSTTVKPIPAGFFVTCLPK